MENKYELVRTILFEEEYYHEYRYSVMRWGEHHADEFFLELEGKLLSLQYNPYTEKHPALPRDYRHIHYRKGIYVFYQICEEEKQVVLLGVVGNDKFHELCKEVELNYRKELAYYKA